MQTRVLRQTFLDFFAQKQHTPVPSAPLVPKDDPTLLFVNAGMVPFKQFFIGQATPPFKRAASAQKCVRAGGKHNDLDMVGLTKRHHTFFEMLGNFSFGDYFKEEAIVYAFAFLSKTLALDTKRLYVTYYHTDTETRDLWRKVTGFGDDKLLPIATADNFWSMGPEGPCGPCTEIFYDHGAHLHGGLPGTPDEDGDRFVEIWNLVFMQFNQHKDGTREALPQTGVDTGSGLERLAAVVQGTDDNYNIDLFKALMQQAATLLGVTTSLSPATNTALKVVADHLRSASFLMADGVLPANEGRGYVLRRIIRRAHRFALKAHKEGTHRDSYQPMMAKLVDVLTNEMAGAYPELQRAKTLIEKNLLVEEESFALTLSRAEGLFADKTKSLKPGETLPPQDAFLLYDTYGLPKDVLQDMLSDKGLLFDEAAFDADMQRQKETARGAGRFQATTTAHNAGDAVLQKLSPTTFLGYTSLSASASLLAVLKDGQPVDHLNQGDEAIFVFDKTPFYGESGGQQGDFGVATSNDLAINVIDTQKKGGIVLHHGRLEKGQLTKDHLVPSTPQNTFCLTVKATRRHGLKVHHSATHLLHAALRSVLGDHVAQKGSLVLPDRLRFDFSHFEKLTKEQLEQLETHVNQVICTAAPVCTEVTSLQKAQNAGAMALFGEAYGDEVRVVTMGTPEKSSEAQGTQSAAPAKTFSKELCGGTHVAHTGEIGFFKIVSESGVAKGIRRIEAVAGQAAHETVRQLFHTLHEAQALLGASHTTLLPKLQALLDEKKALLKKQQQGGHQRAAFDEVTLIKGAHTVVLRHIKGGTLQDMRAMWDQLRAQHKAHLVALMAQTPGKTSLLIGSCTKDMSAAAVLKKILGPLQGRGGGRADMAQGGFDGKLSLPQLESLVTEAI